MPILRLCHQPPSLTSSHDVLSETTVREFSANGMEAKQHDFVPDTVARLISKTRLPGGRTLLQAIAERYSLPRMVAGFHADDVAWFSGTAGHGNIGCKIEKRLSNEGRYIFHLTDDWLSVPALEQLARARLPIAQMIAVPTEGLVERVSSEFPNAPVELLEEPVDVERLAPPVEPRKRGELPMVVWCGNPHNLRELPDCDRILTKVYAEVPFCFRVISGTSKPDLEFGIPWEWKPYSYAGEAAMLHGAAAGLVPVKDSAYARCKGTYKPKTYLAAGVPLVASPVGYCKRVVRHGENGFLADSVDDWVSSLLLLLRDGNLAEKMSVAARADAIARFSHQALIPQWAETLKKHFPRLDKTGRENETQTQLA